ncbi:polymorphic toxin type 44 domain-containing protein [Solimonas sp. K1W22B-7]|uniref:polymorphic toxin type 44 domain-containing protein n=1 Tax=Solimonas sp. K1W22B-7 TaxID=2303331 RepID=UPI0013C42079|nr:polymorphic toxin type 44 domain-containing protein [Solimonas sp. K1W22B-7]
MNGYRNSNKSFMDGFLRGQDFVAKLQLDSDIEEAQKAGVGNDGKHGALGLQGPDVGRYHEDGKPPSLPSGRVLDPLLEELRRGPEARGSFDEVTDFMHGEMKENYQSKAVNMLAEANRKLQKTWALAGWANLVWPEHAWDHKPMLSTGVTVGREDRRKFKGTPAEWFKDGNDRYGYEIWSNVHYGYIGRRSGFHGDTLLSGAGVAQLATLYGKRGKKEERSNAWRRALLEGEGRKGLDDPPDSSAIRLGIHLYEKYGDRMTLDQLRKEVRAWPGLKVIRAPVETEQYIYSKKNEDR